MGISAAILLEERKQPPEGGCVFVPGGGKGARTPDIQLAKLALSQLSYTPTILGVAALIPHQKNNRPSGDSAHAGAAIAKLMVGPIGFEPMTSRLSAGRSNQLSYGPVDVRLGNIIRALRAGQYEILTIGAIFPKRPAVGSSCSPTLVPAPGPGNAAIIILCNFAYTAADNSTKSAFFCSHVD